MNAQPVVDIQPQMMVTVQTKRDYWLTDLFDCCSDCGICCCGMFCFPFLACQVASNMNECCCCGATVAMRAVFRTKYNIPGSICEDTCIVECCPLLSLCQIQRDIKKRKELGVF